MKTKILFLLLAALVANLCVQSQPPVQQQEPQRYIVQSDKGQSQDISAYRVVRDCKWLKMDFMNISESDLLAFLKGEMELMDHQSKIIFQFAPTGEELMSELKFAMRNSIMDAIINTFSERMNKYGPQLPNKSANELTDEEISDYTKKCQEYLKGDKENVEKIRGYLQHLREAGFANEADILKNELNRRKNSNKAWVDRYPRTIVRNRVE